MIEVLPTKEENNDIILTCYDDKVEKGYISFSIDQYVANLNELVVYGDFEKINEDEKTTYSLLIKSCGSYILNRSCFYIYNSKKELYKLCSSLGFEEKDGRQQITLNKLFNHTCNGGNVNECI